jgi:hypothetical protein
MDENSIELYITVFIKSNLSCLNRDGYVIKFVLRQQI